MTKAEGSEHTENCNSMNPVIMRKDGISWKIKGLQSYLVYREIQNGSNIDQSILIVKSSDGKIVEEETSPDSDTLLEFAIAANQTLPNSLFTKNLFTFVSQHFSEESNRARERIRRLYASRNVNIEVPNDI